MAKIFETSEDVRKLIETKFSKFTTVINLKIMSTTKAKTIIKVSKANPTTEYIAKSNSMVTIVVYEEAFDRLEDLAKEILLEIALNQVDYDFEKDKIIIENDPYKPLFSARKTFGDEKVLNLLELQNVIIEDIENEEKEKKEAEREAKKKNQQAL